MAWDGTVSFTPLAGEGPSAGDTLDFEISFAPVSNEPALDISVRHIPGSGVWDPDSSTFIESVDYVDRGGVHATFTVGMKLFFPTAAAYFAFRTAAYGYRGTLIYFDPLDAGATSYTAILQKCARTDRNVTVEPASSPPPNWGETHADAEWLIEAVNS